MPKCLLIWFTGSDSNFVCKKLTECIVRSIGFMYYTKLKARNQCRREVIEKKISFSRERSVFLANFLEKLRFIFDGKCKKKSGGSLGEDSSKT